MSNLSLVMDSEDWKQLLAYTQAANALKSHIEQCAVEGKQQVSLNSNAVQTFLTLKPPPGLWLKLGSLIGSKLQDA